MTTESDRPSAPPEGESSLPPPDAAPDEALARAQEDELEERAPADIGVEKYVQAAFFVAGILAAYLMGKILLSAWNNLADWPWAVSHASFLISFTEESRASSTLIVGAVVGLLIVLRYYRRPAVRSWATEVASELARVSWPSKEATTNGTLVVLIAGAVATIYVTLLDRFWAYLTNLVYGA
jgi:preprotein translocase subunit SecE